MFQTPPAAIYCAFLFLAGLATAEKKTFNVVSFGNKVEVSVNGGSAVEMGRSFPEQPLYTVELDVNGAVEYRYIQDSTTEGFTRKLPSGASTTFNDFFGRKDTIKHFSPLPMPFEGMVNGQWTRGMGQVKIYNETYIPTIHFTGEKALNFFKSPEVRSAASKDKYSAFFIAQDETKLLEGVSLSHWNGDKQKFCVRMTLGGKDEYHGRNVFKFRYGETDPTFMREKLYTDLLVAVGAPVHQTNLVRVYVSGVPVGMYILQDESSDEKFLRTEFYGDRDAPAVMGIPLDADTGADFRPLKGKKKSYHPDFNNYIAHASEEGHVNYRSDATNERVVKLSRALQLLDTTDEKAVEEFDRKWFDIDVFFKAMAFEYALGHWDSYWGDTSNYALYDDPSESDPPRSYKFYFLDEDFEFTFGSCLSDNFNEYGHTFPKQSYKTLLNRKGLDKKGRTKNREMVNKLLSAPALQARFESILIAIVKHLLNPTAMFGRIDAMAERYREEIRWDRSIERLRTGTRKGDRKYQWKLEDLDFGINGYPGTDGPHGVDWGLKPWIQERADAVAKEFGFEYDTVIRLPKTAIVQNEQNAQDVEELNSSVDVHSDVEKSKTSVLTATLIVTSAIMAMASVIG